MLIVGLTGGIASGKTTVAELFAQRGVPLVDADVAAREVVEPGTEGLRRVVAEFGPLLDRDGRLDRHALRGRVFTDSASRSRLEAILHPLIRSRLAEQLREMNAPYALLVAPLLIEAGFQDMVDRVLVVDVPEDLQIQRVMARDRVGEQEARAVLAAQLGREERLREANDVIENAGSLEHLHREVDRLDRYYRSLAATPGNAD